MSSNRLRRIAKELKDIQSDETSKIMAEAANGGSDLSHLHASFPGPPDTPYEGGTFVVNIQIPNEYPFRPPVMKFQTKLWHPNVSSQTVCTSLTLILSIPFANLALLGSHLPRHSQYCMVSCLDYQIRSPLPTITIEHT